MAINNSINSKQKLSSADSPTFTNLELTGQVNDSNGNEIIGLTATSSAVNHVNIANSATTNPVAITAIGTDTNIGINLTPKGTGLVNINNSNGLAKCNGFVDTNNNTWIATSATASSVNYFYMENAATGNAPTLSSQGSDSTVNLGFGTYGNTGIFTYKPGVGGGGGATAGAELRLFYANAGTNTFYSGIKASTSLASSQTWTLPLVDGAANTFLQTNGSGQLIFAAAGGGTNTTYEVTQTGHGFSVGQIVYPTGTADTYALSKADSAADAEVGGIVYSVPDANHFYLQMDGYSNVLSGLTAGATYFLSDVTAGAYTVTPPTTAGHVIKPVFQAVSATEIILRDYIGTIIPSSSGAGAPSPGWELIQSYSLSSTSSPLTCTSSALTEYNTLFFEFESVICSSTTSLVISASNNGGSSYAVTGATFGVNGANPAAGMLNSNVEILGPTAGVAIKGCVVINNSNVTSLKPVNGSMLQPSLGGTGCTFIGGYFDSTVQLNAFQVSLGAGTFTSGTLNIWGQ